MEIPVLSFIQVSNNNSAIPSTCKFQLPLYNTLRKNEPCFSVWRRGEGQFVGKRYLWKSLTISFLIIWESSICNPTELSIPALGAILAPWEPTCWLQLRNIHWLPWREAVLLLSVNISKTGVKQIFTQQPCSICFLIWPVFSPSLCSLSSFCLGSNHGFLGNHEIKMDSDLKGMKFLKVQFGKICSNHENNSICLSQRKNYHELERSVLFFSSRAFCIDIYLPLGCLRFDHLSPFIPIKIQNLFLSSVKFHVCLLRWWHQYNFFASTWDLPNLVRNHHCDSRGTALFWGIGSCWRATRAFSQHGTKHLTIAIGWMRPSCVWILALGIGVGNSEKEPKASCFSCSSASG